MKPPLGTTFVVAASLLGLAAVAQLVAVLVYFGPSFAGAPVAADETPGPVAAVPVAPAEPPAGAAGDDADEADTAERIQAALAEADRLEQGSSPGDALIPLEEALALQPRNLEVLSRLASLYERLGQTELAQAGWRSIIELGPAAGRFLEVAEIRLRLLQPPAAASASSLELRDPTGLQPGASLGVVDLQLRDGQDGALQTKDLRLAVKARPGEEIDARDVRINVTFYETMDGEIMPTMSRVQSMWFTTPVDWKSEGIEILEVKYEVPRLGPDGGPPPQFYGYMVNIYHRGQLQETRADPVNLQELFPPPLSDLPPADAPDFLP